MIESISTQIISNLEAREETKQFIEGYVTAIASLLVDLQPDESKTLLEKAEKLTREGNLLLATK